MRVAWTQFKVYLRGSLVLLVAAAIILVLWKNSSHEVEFWFFGLTPRGPINVVWLMVFTAAGTLGTWWTYLLARSLRRDVRELKRLQAIEKASAMQEKRTAELDERERRIDAKLKHGIAPDDESDA